MTDLKRHIRDVPDFPKPGIVFKDITPLLSDADAFRAAIDALDRPVSRPRRPGARHRVARLHRRRRRLRTRSAPASPWCASPASCRIARTARDYELEYGTDGLEIHHDAVGNGHRVLLVDDLLATGGTARAAIELVERCGGQVVACAFLIELAFLGGRARLGGHEVHALIAY